VVFLGDRSDVRTVYADFDVAVHPSLSENLGGAAESLLLGVPTVTTDVGGFPDLIIPGVTGHSVPARNPQQLAAAIAACLADPGKTAELAARGQAHARRLLDVRTTAGQVHQIYQSISSSRGSTAAQRIAKSHFAEQA
jgi:glycosyltransferase involved in cell wall biosynthesis